MTDEKKVTAPPASGMAPRRCAFCGKGTEEVNRLLGNGQVFICDECIAACSEILSSDDADE